ncbi:TOBE domain-containing protein [Paenirhodobacter populi]|uniref:TOBE domain-containing protein n=1 Tax=Paenirhodobacter populi TaxID=2306993 RepID=UPI0019D4751B|nr:TOBE domain-containing protein [Sinirhodobacter populi]
MNRVAARVTNAIYAGPALTYLLEGPMGLVLRAFIQNRDGSILPPGSEVTMTWSPAQTMVLEDS